MYKYRTYEFKRKKNLPRQNRTINRTDKETGQNVGINRLEHKTGLDMAYKTEQYIRREWTKIRTQMSNEN